MFLVATLGLRVYLTWITATGYTYGALATPIAFLLFAFFLGFAIMLGAELNAADSGGVAGAGHPRAAASGGWLEEKAESLNGEPGRPGSAPRTGRRRRPTATATS